jgi:hypothetical protein
MTGVWGAYPVGRIRRAVERNLGPGGGAQITSAKAGWSLPKSQRPKAKMAMPATQV